MIWTGSHKCGVACRCFPDADFLLTDTNFNAWMKMFVAHSSAAPLVRIPITAQVHLLSSVASNMFVNGTAREVIIISPFVYEEKCNVNICIEIWQKTHPTS